MQPYRPSFSPRRALIAGVTGLMLLVLQTAANAATQAPPTIAAGTLTIGSDLTYPPYAFMDGETPAGLDPDFMKTLASHLQLKPLFVDTRFANLILGVNAKRIDVIASALYVTPERAKQIDFVPYFKTGGSLLALTGSPPRPRRCAANALVRSRVHHGSRNWRRLVRIPAYRRASRLSMYASSKPRRRLPRRCWRTPSMRSSRTRPLRK